jgi:hypothetical protein
MNRVEQQLALLEYGLAEPISVGKLIALMDVLHLVTLKPAQSEIVRTLREG